MPAQRSSRSPSEDALDLARTPVSNPYRAQLRDPFVDRGVPENVALFVARGHRSIAVVRPARIAATTTVMVRRRAPGLVVALGVLSLVEATAVGVLGLLVIALVNLVNGVGGDRSFYAGRDAAYILLGVLDLAVAVVLAFGAIAMIGGRVSGRIALTAAHAAVIAFSVYWWGQDRVPWAIPLVVGISGLAILIASYQASITRWLGVLRPPQPE